MAIEDAPVISILQFDEKDAYNHDRSISSLIRTQLLHLHAAEYMKVPAKDRTNININDLHTEREASEYIQKVTALLHKYGKTANRGKSKKTKPRTKKTREQATGTTKKRVSRK